MENKINWVIMILLLIFFWPAAIVYAIIKSKDKEIGEF